MDSEEFSMTASQGRSIKKKEKKRKKQGGAKGTPAAQPPPIRPTSNPDSMAERKESTASEETPKPEHDATLDQVGESSIAEDIIAATAAAAAAAPMDDTNSQTSESSHTSTYFSDEKLRWAYAQLERCLERRGDPPAWLLQLVMPETHHEQDRFEQVSDFRHDDEVNLDSSTEVDHPPMHSDLSASAKPFTQSTASASAIDHPSSVNQPASVEHSFSSAPAAARMNAENLPNDSHNSIQHEQDTSRYDNARNLAEDFNMSRDERRPTSRNRSTPTPLERTTNASMNPGSLNYATSGAQPQVSRATAELSTAVPPTTAENSTAVPVSRNPVHFVMKQSDLPKDLILTGRQKM